MALIAEQTKRLINLHGWLAVSLSILLYTVMLTGTVVVFSHEIGHWAEGKTGEAGPLSKPLNRHFQRLAAQVPVELQEDIIVGEGPNGTLRFFFGSSQVRIEAGRSIFGRQFLVDPASGRVVKAQAGLLEDLGTGIADRALEDFLVDLHVRLHVPGRWGLYITGTLGVVMLISAITGVLIHRNIFRDFFVTERPGDRVVSIRDRHNLAGVWSLPFAILLSFTGAFLSFAVSLGLPILAMVAFGGDQEAALEAVIGVPVIEEPQPANLANLDPIVAEAEKIAKAPITVINIHRGGRADAIVETFHAQAPGALRGTSLEFKGPSGAFLGHTHLVGTQASVGSTLAELTAPLHFGDFAGKTSRLVWAALGAAMTFTIVSGMQLWVRRRHDDPFWNFAGRVFSISTWVVPLAMLGAVYGYFLTKLGGNPSLWTARAFLLALCASLLVAAWWWVAPVKEQNKRFGRILAVGVLLLPILRTQTGGLSIGEALATCSLDVLFIDALCVLVGAAVWAAIRSKTGQVSVA